MCSTRNRHFGDTLSTLVVVSMSQVSPLEGFSADVTLWGIPSPTLRGFGNGLFWKIARKWPCGAWVVAKRVFIAQIWTKLGRNGMAGRDEARHGTDGHLHPHVVSAWFGDSVLGGSPHDPEVFEL